MNNLFCDILAGKPGHAPAFFVFLYAYRFNNFFVHNPW